MNQTIRNVQVYNRKTGKYEEHAINVSVDTQEIAKMLAHKALNNKSGQSKYLAGTIVVSMAD